MSDRPSTRYINTKGTLELRPIQTAENELGPVVITKKGKAPKRGQKAPIEIVGSATIKEFKTKAKSVSVVLTNGETVKLTGKTDTFVNRIFLSDANESTAKEGLPIKYSRFDNAFRLLQKGKTTEIDYQTQEVENGKKVAKV